MLVLIPGFHVAIEDLQGLDWYWVVKGLGVLPIGSGAIIGSLSVQYLDEIYVVWAESVHLIPAKWADWHANSLSKATRPSWSTTAIQFAHLICPR